MVANFLLEGDVAYTDQQIGESLSLPQRQVRAILEARLCKDFITETEIPSSGNMGSGPQNIQYSGSGSAWYRICPDIINATWYRLTQTEKAIHDKLKSVQESESYICQRCGGREFDALRAVSLYSQQDGLFHCDICEDVLQMRQNRAIREEVEATLNLFYKQFDPIKERLEGLSKMYIPRHIVIKKTVHDKLLEQAKKDAASNLGNSESLKRDFSSFRAAVSNLTNSQSYERSTTQLASAPDWIRDAQYGALEKRSSTVSDNMKQPDPVKREPMAKLVKLEDHTSLRFAVKSPDITSLIQSVGVSKKEEIQTVGMDVYVNICGAPYSIEEVRANDSLIERMTDEEYSRFDELMQKLGFK